MECFLTFIFVLVVLAVTAKKSFHNVAGIVIGAGLCSVHLFGITLTGTGVNPARSFGPALAKAVFGDVTPLSQVWVFILAPLLGGVLAALCYLIMAEKKKEKKEELSEEIETIEIEEIEE